MNTTQTNELDQFLTNSGFIEGNYDVNEVKIEQPNIKDKVVRGLVLLSMGIDFNEAAEALNLTYNQAVEFLTEDEQYNRLLQAFADANQDQNIYK